MYATTQLLHDKIREKKEQLHAAKQKEESLVDSLCSQRKASKELEYSIEELESNLKGIIEMTQRTSIKSTNDHIGSALRQNCPTDNHPGISGSIVRGEG